MQASPMLTSVVCAIGLGMTSCQSTRIEKKAEEYRRSGVARDMVEARRMAESFYWPESAQISDSERRQRTEVFPLKRDANR